MSKGIAIGVLGFFLVNLFVHRMVKIRNSMVSLFHIKLKFLCVSSTLGLELTNTPGRSNFLGSNLTGSVFFSNWRYSVSKKYQLLIFLLMFW